MTLIKSKSSLPTFFDDFLTKDLHQWTTNNPVSSATLPAVNIIEGHEGFVIEMAAPGLQKKDFKIELNHDKLIISCQSISKNKLREGDRYTRREFNYQSFQRTFHLAKSEIDESNIKAKYEQGILRILIPKREDARTLPPRQIAIA